MSSVAVLVVTSLVRDPKVVGGPDSNDGKIYCCAPEDYDYRLSLEVYLREPSGVQTLALAGSVSLLTRSTVDETVKELETHWLQHRELPAGVRVLVSYPHWRQQAFDSEHFAFENQISEGLVNELRP